MKNIIDYFKETVKKFPDKTAIVDGERRIDFNTLNNEVKNLAQHIIIKINNLINRPIAVYLPKSVQAIVADISITYSGNIYINLDVASPSIRIKNILEQIKPEAVITSKSLVKFIREIDSKLPLIIFDEIDVLNQVNDHLITNRLGNIIDTDPLCIISTSGSTGTPKEVVLNHRNYIDYTKWAIKTFNFNETEKLGVLSPIYFDHFNFEICLMMFTGSTLILLDNNKAMFPIKLLEKINEEQINFIFWVPSIMVNIANMNLLSKINLNSLKMIWFAGEVFPTKQFNYWRKYLSEAKFVNLYGPIETTVDCTYFIVNRQIKDDEPIPIGHPCRNTDILILNKKNKLAATNEEGELCVRGVSLAMGYYNEPERTAAAFVQNPLNNSYPEIIYRTGDIVYKNELGEIIFIGRKDSLIKHMGYRIELGEIDHVIINTLKLVENGCVIYNQYKKEIILFYESKNDISIEEMRKAIGKVLPKYMLPKKYYRMDVLPRNANGKIDRLLLQRKIINDKAISLPGV